MSLVSQTQADPENFPFLRSRQQLRNQPTDVSGDDVEHRKQSTRQNSSLIKTYLTIFLLLLSTNLITFIALSSSSTTDSVLRELNTTKTQVKSTESVAAELHARLRNTNSLVESLLVDIGKTARDKLPSEELDGWRKSLHGELAVFAGPHALPFGFTPNIGASELLLPMGAACRRYQDEIEKYMKYDVGKECPVDYDLAQRLILKGCEPLPRRRCRNRSPEKYVEPTPLPKSLWSIPPDTSVVWDHYTCKNYNCLVNRRKDSRPVDCIDCFNLNGRESSRWQYDDGFLDFSIDYVLSTKPPGTIRIGVDLGGGTGTFAARMSERGVTMVVTTMNFDGPFNNFVASRGLVPLYITVGHRLPFFEGTLDIVHSMHVLSNWIPDQVLEFVLYDIYRVLRPGGVFWLDHFFCVGDQLNGTYVPMIEKIGFHKLRWITGRKLDQGLEKNEWYLSALLEKPVT